MQRYEVLAHTADTGILAHGASLAEAFDFMALNLDTYIANLKEEGVIQ